VPEDRRLRVQQIVLDWMKKHEGNPGAFSITRTLVQGNDAHGRPVFYDVPEAVLPLLTQAGIPFELI
jgi:hypothetical protein